MLIGGILAIVFRGKVSETMDRVSKINLCHFNPIIYYLLIFKEMRSSLRLYGNRRSFTRAWDETQERLKCCGVESFRDWQLQGGIPESCCQETYGGQKKPCVHAPSPATLYGKGCVEVASIYVKEHAAIIGGAGIAVAMLMILGMIFSCTLFNMIE